MMLARATIAALLVAASSAQTCGTEVFRVAGANALEPVAALWGKNYAAKCNIPITTDVVANPPTGKEIVIEGGGAAAGAARVCNTLTNGGAVDIGMVSRAWRPAEATTTDGWNYQCARGDKTRKVIKVDVVVDGVTLVVKKGGVGAACINQLGGLTVDQIRWIYSSYTIAQLKQTGWSDKALAAGTGSTDNVWSSLNKNCASSEINISGPTLIQGTYESFRDVILTDWANGETADKSGLRGYFAALEFQDIVDYVEADASAIGFIPYAFYFANTGTLLAASVQNRAGEYIAPDGESIQSNDYNPLSRRLHMNLLTTTIGRTRPYLEYGFSNAGDANVKELGYEPLPLATQIQMLSRAKSTKGINIDAITCGTNGAIRVGGVTNLRPHMTVWSGHYSDKCPKVDVVLINTTPALAFTRVCGLGSAIPLDVATSNVKTTGSVAANAYTFNCPTGSTRDIIELVLAPGPLYGYANSAPAVLAISRGFLRFALSDAGAKLVTLLGATPNSDAVNTQMLSRIPNPGGFGCFAGQSTVQVLNKGSVAMKDLKLGDMVEVNGGKFSEVYSFGHYEQDIDMTFLSIDAGLKKPLLVTADHMVFVENKPVRASTVAVGDKLSLRDGVAIVKKIKPITSHGAFAPFTKDGSIVVDAVVASSYVSLQDESNLVIGGVNTVNMHSLAHVFQAPHRLVCEIHSAFCLSETYVNGLSIWIKTPLAAAQWIIKQNPLVMLLALIPAVTVVILAAFMESIIVNPFLVITVLVVLLNAFVIIRKSKRSA